MLIVILSKETAACTIALTFNTLCALKQLYSAIEFRRNTLVQWPIREWLQLRFPYLFGVTAPRKRILWWSRVTRALEYISESEVKWSNSYLLSGKGYNCKKSDLLQCFILIWLIFPTVKVTVNKSWSAWINRRWLWCCYHWCAAPWALHWHQPQWVR